MPMESTVTRERSPGVPTCTVCGSNRTRHYLQAQGSVYRCVECSHVFSVPESTIGAEHYDVDYFEHTHRNWFAHPNIDLFRWIVGQIPNGVSSVLDAGCGRGAFLRFLRKNMGTTSRLVGIDYSSNNPDSGIEYRQGDITKLPKEDRFDVVVSLAVIEHVADPVLFASTLFDRCNPGGMVVVMTLDNDSLLYSAARLMARVGVGGPCERLYSAHHLQHFTSHSLKIALGKSGMEVIRIHHHNAPVAALDIPAANSIVGSVYMLGVIGLLWAGFLVHRTYLQTAVARRAK